MFSQRRYSRRSMDLRGAGTAPTRNAVAATVVTLLVLLFIHPIAVPSLDPGTANLGTTPALLRVAPTGPSWDNGVVRLTFNSPFPSFTVTADQDGRIAAADSLNTVAEIRPGGGVTAVGLLRSPTVVWNFAASAGTLNTTIWLTGVIPVYGTNGEWESGGGFLENGHYLGSAGVAIAFILNASDAANPNEARFTVEVTSWPWWNTADELGLEMKDTAAGGTTLLAAAGPNQLNEVSSGTQSLVASLSWDSEAVVRYGSGTLNASTVGTYRVVALDGSNSTIRLSFGAVGGGYAQLSYDPTVRLNLGAAFAPITLPAWTVTQTSFELIAMTLLVVLLLGGAAYRRRSTESPPP
jgi:hypothetical protein